LSRNLSKGKTFTSKNLSKGKAFTSKNLSKGKATGKKKNITVMLIINPEKTATTQTTAKHKNPPAQRAQKNGAQRPQAERTVTVRVAVRVRTVTVRVAVRVRTVTVRVAVRVRTVTVRVAVAPAVQAEKGKGKRPLGVARAGG